MKNFVIISLIYLSLLGCKNATESKDVTQKISDTSKQFEMYRPKFHFTPKENWMNDPNGLVYYNGSYHLFYQYYPDSTVWGPMHWGHAKSKDLLNWEHRPIALYPDSLGYVFSGSAVIDKNDSAGFGKNAMVAMFTYHDPVKEKAGGNDYQTQGIAFSNDEGETWTKFNENPVIKNPGITDFRDPKVFWNEEKSIWQMVLVAKDHVLFYESTNLKDWKQISEFRFKDNPALGVWECPDLFKLNVEGTQEDKWVLLISHGGESAPNGGSGTRYFVGDYDGKTFTTEQTKSQWIDYGTDNYAGVTFNNTPNNERVFIGWMSNWNYATTTPTEAWRSAMTLPRTLSLKSTDDGFILKSKLIEGFDKLTHNISKEELLGEVPGKFSYTKLQESIISFNVALKSELELKISNSIGDAYVLKYNAENGILTADRSKSGNVEFNKMFLKSSIQTVNIGKQKNISITLVLDASSIEVFINDGEFVLTSQVFPNANYTNFEILPDDNLEIQNFNIQSIKSTL